jgi:hypothetical protein
MAAAPTVTAATAMAAAPAASAATAMAAAPTVTATTAMAASTVATEATAPMTATSAVATASTVTAAPATSLKIRCHWGGNTRIGAFTGNSFGFRTIVGNSALIIDHSCIRKLFRRRRHRVRFGDI